MRRGEKTPGVAPRPPQAGEARARWDVAIALTGAVILWLGLALIWPWLVLEPLPAQLAGAGGRPPWYLLAPAMLAALFPAGWVGLVVLLVALAGLPLLDVKDQTGPPRLRRGLVLAGLALAGLLSLAGWWRAW